MIIRRTFSQRLWYCGSSDIKYSIRDRRQYRQYFFFQHQHSCVCLCLRTKRKNDTKHILHVQNERKKMEETTRWCRMKTIYAGNSHVPVIILYCLLNIRFHHSIVSDRPTRRWIIWRSCIFCRNCARAIRVQFKSFHENEQEKSKSNKFELQLNFLPFRHHTHRANKAHTKRASDLIAMQWVFAR